MSDRVVAAYTGSLQATEDLTLGVQALVNEYANVPFQDQIFQDNIPEAIESADLLPSISQFVSANLPGNLTQYRRSVEVVAPDGMVTVVEKTFSDELDDLYESFADTLAALSLNDTEIQSIPGVNISDDGTIILDGDIIESRTDISSIMDLFLMYAEYHEVDMGVLIGRLAAELPASDALESEFGSGDGTGVKASAVISRASLGLWSNGVVRYYFDPSITPFHRKIIKEAMDIWTKSTNGEVSFVLDQYGYPFSKVKIGSKPLGGRTAGLAAIGRQLNGYLWLDPAKVNSRDETDAIGIALHELGHTLGLEHEQKRPDRDKYLVINSSDINDHNYTKLEYRTKWEKTVHWEIRKIGFIKTKVPVYSWTYRDDAKVFGVYDVSSIMQYDNIKIKHQNSAINGSYYALRGCDGRVATRKTNRNQALTKCDISAIKELY